MKDCSLIFEELIDIQVCFDVDWIFNHVTYSRSVPNLTFSPDIRNTMIN